MKKQTTIFFALAIFLFMSASVSRPQGTPTISFTVEVTDYLNTTQPIAGASVCVAPEQSTTAPDYQPAFWGKWFTDGAGRVTINNIPVPPGMVTNYISLRIVKQGYKVGGVRVTPQWLANNGNRVQAHLEAAISQPSLNSPNSDCGTPPPNPLTNMTMTIDRKQETAKVGDLRNFKLWWSMYDFAKAWYLYDWQIDNPSVADRTGPQFTSAAFQVKAKSVGAAKITAYLIPPNNFRKASEQATIQVLGSGSSQPPPNEPFTFGWETRIGRRARIAFQLPDSCVDGKTLSQIVHARRQPDCSIRTDRGLCAQCHRMGGAAPTLENISKQGFINVVQNFINNPNANPTSIGSVKPQNLKDFFRDWMNRGFPD